MFYSPVCSKRNWIELRKQFVETNAVSLLACYCCEFPAQRASNHLMTSSWARLYMDCLLGFEIWYVHIYIYNLFKPLMCCTQYFVKINLPIVTFYNIFNVSYWYRGISWVHSDLKHFDLHNLYVYALICWFDVLTNDYSYHVQKKCHNRKVILRWHSGYSNPRIAGIEDSVGSTRGWRHYFWTVTSRGGFL